MLTIRFFHFTLLHSSSYVCDEQIYYLLNISEQDPEKGSTLSQWKFMLMKHL